MDDHELLERGTRKTVAWMMLRRVSEKIKEEMGASYYMVLREAMDAAYGEMDSVEQAMVRANMESYIRDCLAPRACGEGAVIPPTRKEIAKWREDNKHRMLFREVGDGQED
jgi:hypothetical protein